MNFVGFVHHYVVAIQIQIATAITTIAYSGICKISEYKRDQLLPL